MLKLCNTFLQKFFICAKIFPRCALVGACERAIARCEIEFWRARAVISREK
jgi:hypothetical protein